MKEGKRIAELEALLDHYRGQCQECGRDGVLLDFISGYDGMEQVCLLDQEGCQRLHEEQAARANEEFRERVAAGDPRAVMIDHFNRSMLGMSRKAMKNLSDDLGSGTIVQWVTGTTSSVD